MLASLANHLGSAERQMSPEDDDDDVEEIPRDPNDSSDPKASAQRSEPGDAPTKRKRNFAHRTKTGCHTCRHRKKKCDEQKPICGNCIRGSFECGGYGQKPPNFKPQSAAGTKPHQVLQSRSHYEMPPQPQPTTMHHMAGKSLASACAAPRSSTRCAPHASQRVPPSITPSTPFRVTPLRAARKLGSSTVSGKYPHADVAATGRL